MQICCSLNIKKYINKSVSTEINLVCTFSADKISVSLKDINKSVSTEIILVCTFTDLVQTKFQLV